MQVIKLQVSGKLYVCNRITAFYAKEALAIYQDTIAYAKKSMELAQSIPAMKKAAATENQKLAENTENKGQKPAVIDTLKNSGIDEAVWMFDELEKLRDRKVNLICKVYGEKFTADDIMQNLTGEEIDKAATHIMYAIHGIIIKN